MLHSRDITISKVNQRGAKKYIKMTMEYGIQCPKTVQEVMEIDRKNGNTLWADAISKEVRFGLVAFDIR